MEAEYTIRAYEKNQINLYAVLGEANSRTFMFNIIEKSGTVAATSNAVPVNQMLDLTGYTVSMEIADTDIHTDGTIINAVSGKVSFILPSEFTCKSGAYPCEIVLSKENERLCIIGITLNVAHAEKQKENQETVSNDITVDRGTDFSFGISNIKYDDGTSYEYNANDIAVFGVKVTADSDAYLIYKTLEYDTENECFVVSLLPEDTINLGNDKEYLYDVSIQTEDGFYKLIKPARFFVAKAITERTVT